jgi:predicted transglutaminase-like protease
MIYLNTKPIVKPKKKPKAEREQYAAWCAKYGIDPSGKTKKKKDVIRNITLPGTVYKPFIRETVKYPSLDTGHKGAVTTGLKKHTYTGDKMLGVATMHKSNMVPIFNDESAVDVAQMRR